MEKSISSSKKCIILPINRKYVRKLKSVYYINKQKTYLSANKQKSYKYVLKKELRVGITLPIKRIVSSFSINNQTRLINLLKNGKVINRSLKRKWTDIQSYLLVQWGTARLTYLLVQWGTARLASILRLVMSSWLTGLDVSPHALTVSSRAGMPAGVRESAGRHGRVQLTSSDSLLCSSCLPSSLSTQRQDRIG